jgi:hypothetical protein
MRIALAAMIACLAAPAASLAEPARYSDSEFLRASRCAALNDVPALKAEAEDMAWLAPALKAQRRGREDFILSKAGEQARDIARQGRKANTEDKIAALRAQRAQDCAGLAAPG